MTSETSSSPGSPQIDSCCYCSVVSEDENDSFGGSLTATSMRSLATSSMLRITFFSIFTSWDSFLARSGPKAPPALRRSAWPSVITVSDGQCETEALMWRNQSNTHQNCPFQRIGRPWSTMAVEAVTVFKSADAMAHETVTRCES